MMADDGMMNTRALERSAGREERLVAQMDMVVAERGRLRKRMQALEGGLMPWSVALDEGREDEGSEWTDAGPFEPFYCDEANSAQSRKHPPEFIEIFLNDDIVPPTAVKCSLIQQSLRASMDFRSLANRYPSILHEHSPEVKYVVLCWVLEVLGIKVIHSSSSLNAHGLTDALSQLGEYMRNRVVLAHSLDKELFNRLHGTLSSACGYYRSQVRSGGPWGAVSPVRSR